MVERIQRRPNRVNIRRPLPPPPNQESQQFTHTSKKPVLAVTGTKTDRICTICLGKLEPGIAITFCKCGKYFHLDCISELGECPLCNYTITLKRDSPDLNGENEMVTSNGLQENDIMEIVYQCPACESYVPEKSEKCSCGAIFDIKEEEVFFMPWLRS